MNLRLTSVSTIANFYFCHFCRIFASDSRKSKGEKSIWQRRYFEHTIIDEEDLNKHIDYIHYNPMKHYNIAPKDWKYSSFNKFVQNGHYEQNWCNFEDKYNIKELDYE